MPTINFHQKDHIKMKDKQGIWRWLVTWFSACKSRKNQMSESSYLITRDSTVSFPYIKTLGKKKKKGIYGRKLIWITGIWINFTGKNSFELQTDWKNKLSQNELNSYLELCTIVYNNFPVKFTFAWSWLWLSFVVWCCRSLLSRKILSSAATTTCCWTSATWSQSAAFSWKKLQKNQPTIQHNQNTKANVLPTLFFKQMCEIIEKSVINQ